MPKNWGILADELGNNETLPSRSPNAMANAYRIDPELLATAREVWMDCARDDAATVRTLVDSEVCGRSKAYELVRSVRSDYQAETTERVDVAAYAIAAWRDLVESATSAEERRAALTGLTNALARLKIREIEMPRTIRTASDAETRCAAVDLDESDGRTP